MAPHTSGIGQSDNTGKRGGTLPVNVEVTKIPVKATGKGCHIFAGGCPHTFIMDNETNKERPRRKVKKAKMSTAGNIRLDTT
jgi:hypothetical protein